MTRHEGCSICQHIPDVCREFVVGGELRNQGLPPQEAQLEIVGASFFNDDRVSTRTILKRCPECGTFYEWDYEYEYLVGGSEDDVTLTRLSDEEGQRREAEAFATIEAARASFMARTEDALRVLREETDPKQLSDALDVFEYGQLVQGFDILFAISTLAKTLKRLGDAPQYADLTNSIALMLSREKRDSPDTAREILRHLGKPRNDSHDAAKLREWCLEELAKIEPDSSH